jgi:hypothetical protein
LFRLLSHAASDFTIAAMPCFKSTNKHAVNAQRFEWACRQEPGFFPHLFFALVLKQTFLFFALIFPQSMYKKSAQISGASTAQRK